MRTLSFWTGALLVCALTAACSNAPTSPTADTVMGSGFESDGVNGSVPLTAAATARPSTRPTRVNLKGIVSAIDADAETLTVGSTVITVTATTKIVDAVDAPLTFADITLRNRVHVVGASVSGVTTASMIQVLDFAVTGAVSAFDGGCPTPTFTVDSIAVVTTATTEFARGDCTKLADGMEVEVRGVLDLGVLTASRVQLPLNIPPKNPAKNVRIRGTISAFEDATCPTKTFTVAGKEVRTDASTLFTGSGKCAAIAVGKKVDVTGIQTTDVDLTVYVQATRLNVAKK